MKNKLKDIQVLEPVSLINKENEFEGYKYYPPEEDIYNKEKEESDLDPENITKNKMPNERIGLLNEKDFNDDFTGDDLDIPGSELDDEMEMVGSEDEENNYYSLGGDNYFDSMEQTEREFN